MYEFSKKEIKNKFKQTEYGQKTNKWLYISATIAASIFIVGILFLTLYCLDILKIEEELFFLMTEMIGTCIIISFLVACYFDGKRDGAIEQFKKDLKK